eukprot:GFKZ01012107.1.p1 GENE.GFKZ01012107.1~~GFKZ01012107.1.p1  ORF type:complete len:111 (+),score=6.19 GFKZ01012107.1:65-397(+)
MWIADRIYGRRDEARAILQECQHTGNRAAEPLLCTLLRTIKVELGDTWWCYVAGHGSDATSEQSVRKSCKTASLPPTDSFCYFVKQRDNVRILRGLAWAKAMWLSGGVSG